MENTTDETLPGADLGRGVACVHVRPASVVVKTLTLYTIMITGAIWEHDVYGKWWFAHEFFIEDVMTANVFALHIAYLVAFYGFPADTRAYVAILCVAYCVYGLNVAQYIVSHMRTRAQDQTSEKIAA